MINLTPIRCNDHNQYLTLGLVITKLQSNYASSTIEAEINLNYTKVEENKKVLINTFKNYPHNFYNSF